MRLSFLLPLVLCNLLLSGTSKADDPSYPVFTPYGFVKFEAIYDSDEVAAGDWLLYVHPGDSQHARQSVFTMNARHTRLGVRIDGGPVGNGQTSALVEVDFAGGFPNSSTAARQPLLRLRHAWAQMAFTRLELRFGQDWALIAGPFPNTASFVVGAGKGNLWMRFAQARLLYKQDSFKAAVSFNRPMAGNQKYDDNAGGDFDVVGDGERSGLPWTMGRVWWTRSRLDLSVSAHHGFEEISDLAGCAHTMTSYSINGHVVVSVDPVTLTLKSFYGENLNSFFGGIFQGFARDSLAVTNIESMGGFAEVRYRYDQHFSFTVGAGVDDPDDTDLDSGMRTQNTWGYGNIAYSPVKPFVLILEENYLRTEYLNQPAGSNLRTQFVVYYKF